MSRTSLKTVNSSNIYEAHEGNGDMHTDLIQSPSDEKETSRIAIEKLKDERFSTGIRLNFALMMLPLEKGNRLALYSAKIAIENHSSGHKLLKWTLGKLHAFMDSNIDKDELSIVLKDIESFHEKSILKHSRGFKDPLTPCSDETIARMLVLICQNFIESNERSCGFTISSIGAWVASEFGQEIKEQTEQAHVDFLIRLLERPSFRLV